MTKSLKIVIRIIIVLALVWFGYYFWQKYQKPAEEKTIKIGTILPLTGKGDYIGEEMRNGILLAADKINSAGGINGKKIEIVVEDDKTSAAEAVTAMQKLIEVDKVGVFLTGMTDVVSALAPIAEKNKVVLFGATTINKPAKDNLYVFKDFVDLEADCKFMGFSLKDKKISLLGANQDSTLVCIDGFKESGDEISYELFNKGENDFRTYLLKIKEKNPDVLVVRGYKQDIVNITKQVKELKINVRLVCPQIKDGCDSPEFVSIAGNSFDRSIGTGFYFDKSDPPVAKFINDYSEKFGREPLSDAFYTYDDIFIISESMKACKNTRDSTCLLNELLKVKDYKGVVGSLSFDTYGIAIRPVYLFEFKNGKWEKK